MFLARLLRANSQGHSRWQARCPGSQQGSQQDSQQGSQAVRFRAKHRAKHRAKQAYMTEPLAAGLRDMLVPDLHKARHIRILQAVATSRQEQDAGTANRTPTSQAATSVLPVRCHPGELAWDRAARRNLGLGPGLLRLLETGRRLQTKRWPMR